MIRGRVWLGTDRQTWYWSCGKCIETTLQQNKWAKSFQIEVGGLASTASLAGDLARDHINQLHSGGRTI